MRATYSEFLSALPEHERGETFRYGSFVWDISHAKFLCRLRNRAPVLVHVSRVLAALNEPGIYGQLLRNQKPKVVCSRPIDYNQIDAMPVTNRPIIFGTVGSEVEQAGILLDGAHRLVHAFYHNRPTITAYMLDLCQTGLCLTE